MTMERQASTREEQEAFDWATWLCVHVNGRGEAGEGTVTLTSSIGADEQAPRALRQLQGKVADERLGACEHPFINSRLSKKETRTWRRHSS